MVGLKMNNRKEKILQKLMGRGKTVSITVFSLLIAVLFVFGNSELSENLPNEEIVQSAQQLINNYRTVQLLSEFDLPEYNGNPAVVINDDKPFFDLANIEINDWQEFSELDSLGRCDAAMACISSEMMPTEERGKIGMIKPSGWQIAKYDFVDGKYLYNRCHLIGYQLTGENANELNLITGTRYLNVEGMLPIENSVAEYIRHNNKHVMYRVTPIFEGDNLLATGVLMEAISAEDEGKSFSICRFCFNVQPGVIIDYSSGKNKLDEKQKNN